MNKQPEVSVVMSAYNGEVYLEETLRSISSQDGVDFEIIVVNDGSTDRTSSILKKYEKVDDRIQVLNQQNSGLTDSLISACAEAKGKFIARQDVGDISLPGRLAGQAAILRERPDAVLVGCNYVLVTPAGEVLREKQAEIDPVSMKNGLLGGEQGLYGPHHGTVMFRKSAYDAVGGYRHAFYFAQDLDLWTRLIEVGELYLLPEVLCQIQFSTGCLSGVYRDQQVQLKNLIAKAVELRQLGESEEAILSEARTIRPNQGQQGNNSSTNISAAAYFIGSCLADRNDPAARNYFLQAIKNNPMHLKAWTKLLRNAFLVSRH